MGWYVILKGDFSKQSSKFSQFGKGDKNLVKVDTGTTGGVLRGGGGEGRGAERALFFIRYMYYLPLLNIFMSLI